MLNDTDIQMIGVILRNHDRVFTSRDLFFRYIQFDPKFPIIGRPQLEEIFNSLVKNKIVSVRERTNSFQFSINLPLRKTIDNSTKQFAIRDFLSPDTFQEIKKVMSLAESGDKLFISTYGGTTFLDEFEKLLEDFLSKSNVCVYMLMLGALSDPILMETDPEKFSKVIETAYRHWNNMQIMYGQDKVKIRQYRGMAGTFRGMILVDKEGLIKYCGVIIWDLGKRGVDGGYLSSFNPKLSSSRLFLDDYFSKWENSTEFKGRAFICHSSKDKTFCRKLNMRLEQDGIPTWFDENDILPGEDFLRQMEVGITQSDYVIIVLSTNFVSGEWAQLEFRTALEREISSKRISVIPIYKQTIPQEDFPFFLRTKNYADFRNNFEKGYSRLLDSLRKLPIKQHK